ncbi:MAG: CRISPR-associated helicase Cas3' [Candidatus Thermoplasmatota archaeon]
MIIGKQKKIKGNHVYQSLIGHTIDSLKILKTYLDINKDIIKGYCKKWELDFAQFVNSTYKTVFLHDIGKICKEFQDNIKEGRASSKYPHALYSFQLSKGINYPTLLKTPIERLAILGHHTQLHTEIYGGLLTKKVPTYMNEEIKNFIFKSEDLFKKLGFSNLAKFTGMEIEEIAKFNDFQLMKELRRYKAGSFDETNIRLKSIYSFILSILQTCDDFSSANFKSYIQNKPTNTIFYNSVLDRPADFTPFIELDDIKNKILENHNPYKFQKEILEECPKYATIFAPCGRGKTEAALMWALKSLKKYKRNKIIFALPTQVTSNAMWERLCCLFGEGKTQKARFQNGKKMIGLFHGKSFLKQKKKSEGHEYINPRDENFKGNVLFKPITITTIDHLMYSAVHGFSQADFAFGNLQNAVVIFDEAHYYEKQTLEHLIAFYRLLTSLDIPHLLMSGTLPSFLINEIKKFNDYKSFEDKKGLNNSPFKIIKKENYMVEKDKVNLDIMKKIVSEFNDGEDVFILLNTVERSKRIYEQLKSMVQKNVSDRIVLYHSRFTHQHRLKKEDIIKRYNESNKPYVLVATQVIEISLDISADKMYSEIAPPDAIGQRGGRLNRKGKHWENDKKHMMNLYLPENEHPYNKEVFKKTIKELEKFEGICNYKIIKNFCDKVYESYKLNSKTNLYGTSENFFDKGVLFGPPYFSISSPDEKGRSLNLRNEKIRKIDVVPQSIYNKNAEEALKIENQVQIPYYKIKQFPDSFCEIEKDEETFIICNMKYSFEKGFNWDTNDSNSTNII